MNSLDYIEDIKFWAQGTNSTEIINRLLNKFHAHITEYCAHPDVAQDLRCLGCGNYLTLHIKKEDPNG